jgi:hypothetical protein
LIRVHPRKSAVGFSAGVHLLLVLRFGSGFVGLLCSLGAG